MSIEQSTCNSASTVIGIIEEKKHALGDVFVHEGVRQAEDIFHLRQEDITTHKFECGALEYIQPKKENDI